MAVKASSMLNQDPASALSTKCTCTANPKDFQALAFPTRTSAFSKVPSQPIRSSFCHPSKALACPAANFVAVSKERGNRGAAGNTRRQTAGPLRVANSVSETRGVSLESGAKDGNNGQHRGTENSEGVQKINGNGKVSGNGRSSKSMSIAANGKHNVNERTGKEFDVVVERQGRNKVQRVEWWRIDEPGELQNSSEAGISQARESAANSESFAGPRRRTVGWMRESHGKESDGEELWTWKASTQTLHLNGNAVHTRLEGRTEWVEEATVETTSVETAVEVTENGAVAGGYLAKFRESLTVESVHEGSEGSVNEGSVNGRSATVERKTGVASSWKSAAGSQNGVGESLMGAKEGSVEAGRVNGVARSENGYGGGSVGTAQIENERNQSENGRPRSSETTAPDASSDVEKTDAPLKSKGKKDGKKKKKAAKLETKKKKKEGKKEGKKKGKKEREQTKSVESHVVDEAGARVRMYPGPGYVDRMHNQKLNVLSSPTDTVHHKKDKLASGGVKTGGDGAPSADNLNERLQDLRRKAIEHKERHEGESGTLLVPTRQPILVLMRHGQSMWNELKLFTGDVDIPLTEKGAMEAMSGGRTVKDVDFDIVFTSRLLRAKQTAMLALTQNSSHVVPVLVRGGYHGEGRIGDGNRLRLREAATYALDKAACKMVPVYAHPALNERCYGDLQGLNKEEAAKEFGKEMVQKWRRSNDTSPPGGESLVDTAQRARKYYKNVIEPRLAEGKNVLVVTHGNVMRGLIAYLASLEQEEMLTLEIATAFPYAYAYSRESGDYAQCCLMKPMEDFITGEPLEDKPMGLASVLKKKNFDSLI